MAGTADPLDRGLDPGRADKRSVNVVEDCKNEFCGAGSPRPPRLRFCADLAGYGAEMHLDDDIGAEGGNSDNADTLPPLPSKDDDTPLGDTDQISKAKPGEHDRPKDAP